MTDRTRALAFRAGFASLLLTATASVAQATTWNVPGDNSNTCTTGTPSCDTIAAAIAASMDGDTIQIAAGTYAESGLVVDKQLTIGGAGAGSTTVTPAGAIGFLIRADGVVLQDLTVQGASDGARLENAGGTVEGTQISGVEFTGSTSDGLEFSGSTSITNTQIADSEFSGGVNGIRMSSTSTVSGVTITGSIFADNTGLGIYQANDGSISTLTGLNLSSSIFSNNGDGGGDAAIYAEEMTDSEISDSTFTDNFRGILLFKAYSSSNVDMGDIYIHDNEFTDSDLQAVEVIVQAGTGAGAGIIVEGNRIEQDVAALDTAVGLIDIRLGNSQTHSVVTIRDNYLALSGTFGTATAAHGIILRGNGPISMTGNILLGGGVDGSGTTPPSSGIFIRSVDASFGTIPASAVISGTCNRIEGFENGVSIFNGVAATFGGLPDGTTVSIEDSTIDNNGQGVVNGATPTVDFENNYWGCEDGPGNPGCDTVVGNVDFDPFRDEPAVCVACLANSECDDTLQCNGVESCNLDTFMCETGTAPDCDDSNACTGDSCNETDGCVTTPVSNGAPCNDGINCSIADACLAGVCDGGGTDLDMSGTCDEDEASELTVLAAVLKAQKPGKANGKATAKAAFTTDPPLDTFSAAAPITVSVRDVSLTGGQKTFTIAECTTKGAKIKCKSADKSAVAVFKADKEVPAVWTMKAKIKNLTIDGPFGEPVTVTLTYGAGTTRTGSTSNCTEKPTIIKCKADSGT